MLYIVSFAATTDTEGVLTLGEASAHDRWTGALHDARDRLSRHVVTGPGDAAANADTPEMVIRAFDAATPTEPAAFRFNWNNAHGDWDVRITLQDGQDRPAGEVPTPAPAPHQETTITDIAIPTDTTNLTIYSVILIDQGGHRDGEQREWAAATTRSWDLAKQRAVEGLLALTREHNEDAMDDTRVQAWAALVEAGQFAAAYRAYDDDQLFETTGFNWEIDQTILDSDVLT